MAQRQFCTDDTDNWNDRFGNGSDGDLTVSADALWSTIVAPHSASGSVGTTSLTTVASGDVSDGNLVLIIQSRGTGVGAWELNKIVSGSGTTTLTMAYALCNTYTDSGNSQAQILRLPQYSSVTINSGKTLSAATWDANVGGIVAFLCYGATTITGSADGQTRGYQKSANQGGASSGGCTGTPSYTGEGTTGVPVNHQQTANGNGGGGGAKEGSNSNAKNMSGGGGGGNGTAGTEVDQNGDDNPQCGAQSGGAGGNAVGNAALTNMCFGGAGGWGGTSQGGEGGSNPNDPGAGGGIILIISKTITITGTINTNGQNGENQSHAFEQASAGGGAGGSILLKCQVATLGANLVTAAQGLGGARQGFGGSGGNGGVGRIHLDYSGTYTGTTSPTIDVSADPILGDSGFLAFM